VLWKKRNICVFQNAVYSSAGMLEKVKLYFFFMAESKKGEF